jgi:hypothetical protein
MAVRVFLNPGIVVEIGADLPRLKALRRPATLENHRPVLPPPSWF